LFGQTEQGPLRELIYLIYLICPTNSSWQGRNQHLTSTHVFCCTLLLEIDQHSPVCPPSLLLLVVQLLLLLQAWELLLQAWVLLALLPWGKQPAGQRQGQQQHIAVM
jgi:hypothetical protein